MTKNAKIELLKTYYQSFGLLLSYSEVDQLQKDAHRIQQLAIYYCNGEIEADVYERRMEILKSRIIRTLDKFKNIEKFEFHGDPRGICFRIKMKIFTTEIMPEYYN